ncbi:MAG: enoyl-CoA hydratase/isomerase family protein [Clostridiales Family XIII bacterium]|jgi:enoyl-CoA hydratase|nr:enoyl-CoA hydratase/isomerase family protein [Clostridiales Family XIII bacterium]
MMKEYKTLRIDVNDDIAVVKINRPEALNALNGDVIDDLEDAFIHIAQADEVKAAILTGEGKAFVAGADIAAMGKMSTMAGRDFMQRGQSVMALIESIEKPVVAAVNGFALGGGCELAMACDVRFASEKAKFGQPEVNLGIIPGFGGTQRLPRLVGKGMAKYLIYSAEIIGAEEALRIGLVEKVFPADELLPQAAAWLKQVLGKAPIAVRMAKVSINNGVNMDIKSAIAFEAESMTAAFSSEDRVEGMSAFVEKRPAAFKNR